MKQVPIVAILASLATLSLVVVRSVAPNLANNQLVFFLLAAIVFAITSNLNFRWWQRNSVWLYLLLVLGLIATLVVGNVTRGSARWISVGGFNIQPSQLAVPIVALLGSHLVNYYPVHKLRGLGIFAILTAIPAFLILIEPDLGSTIIFLFSLAVFIFVSRISFKYLASLLGFGIVLIVLSWSLILQPYQKQRVSSFLAPQEDIQGAGYNAQQALIAVGAGGLLGKGLGRGVQSHLRFLPERQTDFIFASLAEELGFAGSLLVLILYFWLLYTIISSAKELPHQTAQLYLFSISAMLILQITVNIGMNMGLVPITGVTLPFISYGGSSIVSFAFSFGLVASALKDIKQLKLVHLE